MLNFIKNLVQKNGTNENLQKTGSHSIQGRKSAQEDSFFISEEKEKKQLIFVADGVGGHGHGDFASQMAVEIFQNTFVQSQNFGDIPDFLRKTALVVAAMVLQKSLNDPEYKNCGTTLSGFFIDNQTYYTINIGDSRVYAYSKDQLHRITKDHSLVQEMIDKGELTEEEANFHPQKNVMTSAIGQSITMMKIDVNGPYYLEHGDIILAVTDGVPDTLKDFQIQSLIEKHKNTNEIAKVLVESAYNAGGTDNITAVYYRHI